jgi:hypothetical protein
MKTLHNRNLDEMLRDFYRSEMPAPWPVLEAPAPAMIPAKKPPRVRFRALSRLALAAAVAFLLIGYLAFASLVPTEQPRRSFRGDTDPFGEKAGPRPKKKAELRVVPEDVRTPAGREAKMLMEPINGGFIINLRDRDLKESR